MPRRAPAAVRAAAAGARGGRGIAVIRGLSARAARQLAQYESSGGRRPGETAAAFRRWAVSVHGPSDPLRFRDDFCGYDECCRPHVAARDVLADALRALPVRGSRELGALLAPYDARFLARSVALGPPEPRNRWWADRFVL
jgi:hypothetical protein